VYDIEDWKKEDFRVQVVRELRGDLKRALLALVIPLWVIAFLLTQALYRGHMP
jgi:hypothetical protein